jgi:hypothetical protein
MLCPYCKTSRVENEAPCPQCGAPSPIARQAQQGNWGTGGLGGMSYGNPDAPGVSFGAQWDQQQVPQMSFDNNVASSWQQPSGQLNNNGGPSSWQQPSGQLNNNDASSNWHPTTGQLNPMPSWQQPSPSGQLSFQDTPQDTNTQENANQSLVPYQGGMELEPVGRQSTVSLQLVPEHAIQHLLPTDQVLPDTIHIAPMYTKVRPLIPKRRAISGLISVIVVALLLCTGAGYYAQASGTLSNVAAFISGGNPATNMPQAKATIAPLPTKSIQQGPAASAIPSVALAVRIDRNNQPIQFQNTFQPNQTFHLTFSALPAQKTSGQVLVKWYQNNLFYKQMSTKTITYSSASINNFQMAMQYAQPASGKVELYWQNKLAWTLYFSVQ